MSNATVSVGYRLAALASLMTLAGAAFAQAPAPATPPPDWTHSGNVTLVSDYNFRGVSQTQGKPTAQATLDFSHVSGLYAGLFGSGVSHAAYNNGSGSEVDVYGGYKLALDADSNVDLGLVTYWFPGANYTAAGRNIKYHTQDLKIGYNRGPINVYAWLTVSKNWFGFAIDPVSGRYADTKRTTYFEANFNPELAPGLTLSLHAGKQIVRNMEDFNFVDMKVGISKALDVWSFSASVTKNNGEVNRGNVLYWTFVNADGSGKNVVGNRVVLTAGRNF
jgi:uncharacterized protein (TIGR02001 family)